MPKTFRRNLEKYLIPENRSPAAQSLNDFMANSHHQGPGYLEFNSDALIPIRALKGEEALVTLLLAYEHFMWLFGPVDDRVQNFGDNVTYASGLDFVIQILARARKLPFTDESLRRLVGLYLTHPQPYPCLPPHIIVGVIATHAGKLARARKLSAQTLHQLRRVAAILQRWDREEWGSMPPSLLTRIKKSLS